jgi:hypothetical protein
MQGTYGVCFISFGYGYRMSQRGAPAAYRGYRLQALYTIYRLLAPGESDTTVFYPEGSEDLDRRQGIDGPLLETIQVKSYPTLILSHLTPDQPGSFFHRALTLCQQSPVPTIRLVNFGDIGPEMNGAWAGDHQPRTRITQKLREHGFQANEIDLFFTHIALEQVDEATQHTRVRAALQDMLTGVDPDTTLDLLQYWIYLASERKTPITRTDLIARVSAIGRFLAERRDHHQEWFTSIIPLEDTPPAEEEHARLREAFYQGMAARYEHILADLDFRRDNKIAAIAEAFAQSQVVIVSAASGQGKTTLAYRYLHDHYPQQWRFQVSMIQDRRHAATLANALAGHARAVQMPMMIYLDVSPRDTEWPELVSRLAYHPYLRILVTIRSEDLQRASVSGAEFDYRMVELTFDETEARLIYDRAFEEQVSATFLNFDAAWDRFGTGGPLLEFVYLLTQTETLRERLKQQVNRLREEVRSGQAHPDELHLLRLVAVASSYEARLDVVKLNRSLRLPDIVQTLQGFEQEYLVRQSLDRRSVEGLHPVRSAILAELLLDPALHPWRAVAQEALPLMHEEDLESFLLRAMVERQTERTHLLDHLRQLTPATWTGLAGVQRVLLWSDIQAYIDANRHVIEEARQTFNDGWQLVADLDLAALQGDALDNLFDAAGISSDKREQINHLREQQTPKATAFDQTRTWLRHLERPANPPETARDWSGYAELCFRMVHLNGQQIDQSVTDEQLDHAALDLPLLVLAEVSLALFTSNAQRHAAWIQRHLPTLQTRLAHEYLIVALEERDDGVYAHFLPFTVTVQENKYSESLSDNHHQEEPLHAETMERVRLIRYLFPQYAVHGSQGYGHTVGKMLNPSDLDNTRKQIANRRLPLAWNVQINSIARNLAEYDMRPATWSAYVESLLTRRARTLTSLEQLLTGLKKSLQRGGKINVLKEIDTTLWDACQTDLATRIALPEVAVDPWGFGGEDTSNLTTAPEHHQRLLPQAIVLQKYRTYLTAERQYTSALSNFFRQAIHVMVTNFQLGRIKPHLTTKRDQERKRLQERDIQTGWANLTTDNLCEAQQRLTHYQQQFRTLFSHLADADALAALEQHERDMLAQVWQLWFFYAQQPDQAWASPVSQVRAQITSTWRQVEQQVQAALAAVSTDDTTATIMKRDIDWEGKPALWIRLDIEHTLDFYTSIENLIHALRAAVGQVTGHELRSYVIRDHAEYTIIIPVLRGRMLNRLIWRLHTISGVLSERKIDEHLWMYVPTVLPRDVQDALGLHLWEMDCRCVGA